MRLEYKNNHKRYINRYLAIANVYHSLINATNVFNLGILAYESDVFIISNSDRKKLRMAITESFAQSLCIQLSKLDECLWIYPLMNKGDKNFQSEKDKYNDFIIKNDLELNYVGLLEITKRIKESKVKDLRDKIFAHPFSCNKRGDVISLNDVVKKFYEIVRVLVNDEYRIDFEKIDEDKKLRFYVDKHLIAANDNQAKSHLNEISLFMNYFKLKAMGNVTPVLYIDEGRSKWAFYLYLKNLILNAN
ncbi:hypothetical protein AB7459_01320 [Providencia rettgeri]